MTSQRSGGDAAASKTIIKLEDDLDGGAADETLSFAFEGKSYVIDLSTKNADKFRRASTPSLVRDGLGEV